MKTPTDGPVLIPGTRGHVTSRGKRDFAGVIKDLEIGEVILDF